MSGTRLVCEKAVLAERGVNELHWLRGGLRHGRSHDRAGQTVVAVAGVNRAPSGWRCGYRTCAGNAGRVVGEPQDSAACRRHPRRPSPFGAPQHYSDED